MGSIYLELPQALIGLPRLTALGRSFARNAARALSTISSIAALATGVTSAPIIQGLSMLRTQ
jgi:hypothetical protein